jgi:RNA polymerase sigma factor (sigma-70 family)
MAREHVERLLSSQRGSRSLDEPRAGEDPADTALRDRLADPAAEDAYDRVLERLQIDDVRRMLERLGVRERRVLRGRYGIGQPSHTLRELAEELCVSAERVRQIEEEGLERLRRELARRGTWDRHEHEDTEDAP